MKKFVLLMACLLTAGVMMAAEKGGKSQRIDTKLDELTMGRMKRA